MNNSPRSQKVEIPYLGPPRQIDPTELLIGVDNRFFNNPDGKPLISLRHKNRALSPKERLFFAYELCNLANLTEAYCFNDWLAIPGALNPFTLEIYGGNLIEVGAAGDPSRDVQAVKTAMSIIANSHFLLPPMLAEGGVFFDFDSLPGSVRQDTWREKPGVGELFHAMHFRGTPYLKTLGNWEERINEFDRRFSGITNYSTSLALLKYEMEADGDDVQESMSKLEWPARHFEDYINGSLAYEMLREFPVLPSVVYQAEYYQSLPLQRSRKFTGLLVDAYAEIAAAAGRGEALRAEVLGNWAAVQNVNMPPCFVALLSTVKAPEEIPEALVRLRREFEPLRKLRRELESSAANDALEKFVNSYKKISRAVDHFTSRISRRIGEKPVDLSVLSTPVVQADMAAKIDSTPSSLDEGISFKSTLINQVVKFGLDAIRGALLTRRLRPLHTVAGRIFGAPPVPRMIEAIWNVELDARLRDVVALCGQSKEILERAREQGIRR